MLRNAAVSSFILTVTLIGQTHAGEKKPLKSISGTLEKIDTSKGMIIFWYSLGDGIGAKSELNRRVEVFHLDGKCKLIIDEKSGKWASLQEGYTVKIQHKDTTAYQVEAFSPEYRRQLRRDLELAEALVDFAERQAKGPKLEIAKEEDNPKEGADPTRSGDAIFFLKSGHQFAGTLLSLKTYEVILKVGKYKGTYQSQDIPLIQLRAGFQLFNNTPKKGYVFLTPGEFAKMLQAQAEFKAKVIAQQIEHIRYLQKMRESRTWEGYLKEVARQNPQLTDLLESRINEQKANRDGPSSSGTPPRGKGTVYGHLYGSDGKPLAFHKLYFEDSPNNLGTGANTTTNSQGYFELKELESVSRAYTYRPFNGAYVRFTLPRMPYTGQLTLTIPKN